MIPLKLLTEGKDYKGKKMLYRMHMNFNFALCYSEKKPRVIFEVAIGAFYLLLLGRGRAILRYIGAGISDSSLVAGQN